MYTTSTNDSPRMFRLCGSMLVHTTWLAVPLFYAWGVWPPPNQQRLASQGDHWKRSHPVLSEFPMSNIQILAQWWRTMCHMLLANNKTCAYRKTSVIICVCQYFSAYQRNCKTNAQREWFWNMVSGPRIPRICEITETAPHAHLTRLERRIHSADI